MTSEAVRPDAAARRLPHVVETLNDETLRWLAGLPGDFRPRRLPIEYARIANELGRRWINPGNCLAYFSDLLIDRRGDRKGFPVGVVYELAYLKHYYETSLHPSSQTVWDEIIARPHG
jgi:hypothetical protein